MEKEIIIVDDSTREVNLRFSFEEIEKDINAAVKEQVKSISVPGFRKGKAPMHMIKQRFGDSLDIEAAEKVSNDKFWEMVKAEDIHVLGEPSITKFDFSPGSPLTYTVKFEVMPDITLTGYTGLEIEAPKTTVSDELVERELEVIKMKNPTLVDDEKADSFAFSVAADASPCSEDGTVMPGAQKSNYTFDLSNPEMDHEIKEQMLNRTVGEIFTLKTTHHGAHDEHDHVHNHFYQIEVIEVKRHVYPELNDELVAKLTQDKVKSLDEFRTMIKENYQTEFDRASDSAVQQAIQKKILAGNVFVPPVTLVQRVITNSIKEHNEKNKERTKQITDTPELREELRPDAETNVRWYLIQDKIIEIENIGVSDERIKQLAEENASKFGVSVEVLETYYKNDDMRRNLVYGEFWKFLKEKNTITYKEIDPMNPQMQEEPSAEVIPNEEPSAEVIDTEKPE